jgi:hypothetical protein
MGGVAKEETTKLGCEKLILHSLILSTIGDALRVMPWQQGVTQWIALH